MPGIYPNPSAAAESFRVGDQVRWFVNEQSISPYVGVVTQICPSICKVWVEFPIGGNQQKDPTELILVTPFAGRSPVTEDTGYSSYEKEVSEKDYGTLREKTVKLAQRMVAKEIGSATEKTMLSKMASKVAKNFAEGVVEKLAGDVLQCVENKMTDAQAYQSLYPQYETVCSDGFLRTAISKIYEVKTSGSTIPLSENHRSFLLSQPEQGMGYQIVDLKLKNGDTLENRVVVNSTYLKLVKDESIGSEDIESVSISQN